MNTPSQRDPQTLERQADQIRADMDRTLDALERKLSPSQLLDRSLDYLRAHSGDVARAVGETVRRNPVPIALAAAGIGWLIASSLRSRRNFDDTFGDESPYAQPRARRGRFHDRFAATRAQTQRAQDRMKSVVDEQPILLGSIAVAIGALIGALIPATEYEDKIVGQVRATAPWSVPGRWASATTRTCAAGSKRIATSR